MPEMLAVTLLLEIVREAGLRAPKSISHTVSLVGALIIGETAVSAGIISVPVLTMAAAATIATLAVPALYEQSILFRFAVILLAGLFGVPGLACGALLILAIFPGIAYWAASLLGFMSPINFVYVVIIFLLLAKQFFMSIKLSQLDSKVRILTEQVALNEEKVERDKLDL